MGQKRLSYFSPCSNMTAIQIKVPSSSAPSHHSETMAISKHEEPFPWCSGPVTVSCEAFKAPMHKGSRPDVARLYRVFQT